MPRIKDIIDKVLEIVFKDLDVEALIQMRVEGKVKANKLYRTYNQRELPKSEYSELTKKRLRTMQQNKAIKLNLEVFTRVELDIMDIVCTIHSVDIRDFLSTVRRREVINARFQMMAILRNQMFYTFNHIGYVFSKDHSSIIHAMNKHSTYYALETNYKNQYNTILNELEEKHPGLLSAKKQVILSPKIAFINEKFNKLKYYKPIAEFVRLKTRKKLLNAETN